MARILPFRPRARHADLSDDPLLSAWRSLPVPIPAELQVESERLLDATTRRLREDSGS